ncbi:ATP-binding protein [Nonomuraea sp. NPDC047529]|uniref:sensor histidine kinase n=1 Tax=Nonomuraea sp. NPDC047529 TaxID=3155623 RepID=UPI00340F9E0C
MPPRPRLPARTARLRFTVLYGGLFLASGAALLVLVNLVGLPMSRTEPAPGPSDGGTALDQAQEHVALLQAQLADVHATQSRQLLAGSVLALAVMAVVSIVLGRVVAGRVLRPLRTITAATRRISADNLHERLAVPGPADEVKDLADTIDGLLARLEGAFAAQRRFVADASHELRTPLATMRARLDVAVAKPEPVPAQTLTLADRLRTDLDQVDRLLEGLLALARAQHGSLPDAAAIALGDLVARTLDARAADLAARRLVVDDEGVQDGVRTVGSVALVTRLVHNLIDNAIVHNRDGGWIRVEAVADGRWARLVVESGGDLLDPAQVARLGRPFQRLGADRTGSGEGSGLGLSIVAAVAQAHGGGLDLAARPEGGLRATVRLPA